MKSFRDRNPYAVGLASVLMIGAFVGVAFLVGVLHLLERGYQVQGVFDDAAGVRTGANVLIAGVKAGRVTGVKADRRNGKVVISMKVHNGAHLGPNTSAAVVLETLLGTKAVRLTGSAVKPYLQDLPKSRRVIPNERTKTPFDIFELTKVGTRSIEATDTAKLNRLIQDLATITEGKHDQVRDLLEGIARVSGAVNERDTQLRQLLDRADQLSKTLADKDQTLAALIDQSQGVLDLVDRRRDDIARQLETTNTLATRLSSLVGVHRSELDAILATLHPALDILDRRQATVDRALSWIGPGALGLSKATTHGPWQDIYVRAVGPDLIQILKDTLPHP